MLNEQRTVMFSAWLMIQVNLWSVRLLCVIVTKGMFILNLNFAIFYNTVVNWTLKLQTTSVFLTLWPVGVGGVMYQKHSYECALEL